MKTVATLIARGGSTRLPGKNVRPFCGLPLIAWSIIQARCSKFIDEVWMGTDDDEIASISEEYGALVDRYPEDGSRTPDELSGGLPPTRHMLKTILARGDADCWVGMLPTNPLRVPGQLDRMVTEYSKTKGPRVITAIPRREMVLYEQVDNGLRLALYDKWYTYFESLSGDGAEDPVRFLQKTDVAPTQDKSVDASMVQMAIEKTGPVVDFIPLESWQQADVDTLKEFELAEVLMEHYILKGRGVDVYYEYAQ